MMADALDVDISNSGINQNAQPANTRKSLNHASGGTNDNNKAENIAVYLPTEVALSMASCLSASEIYYN